jgi:hypothetical protein
VFICGFKKFYPMPRFNIICMAHSRKHKGRCIAGLGAYGEGWIRPVPKNGGPLFPKHFRLHDGSEPQSLDLISIDFEGPAPDEYQPENWAIAGDTWRLVQRPVSDQCLDLLDSHLSEGPHLFGDFDDKVHKDVVCKMPGSGSLQLVTPGRIKWHLRDNWQARVKFALGYGRYDLPVTDIVWEQWIRNREFEKEDACAPGDKIMFTVSLGRPWEKDGCCYKLVAGVLVIPGDL